MRKTASSVDPLLQVLKDPELDRSELSRRLSASLARNDATATLLDGSALILVCGVADERYDGFVDAVASVTANLAARAALREPAEQLLADAGELVARWFMSLEDPALPALAERVVLALDATDISADLRAAAAVAVLSYVNARVDPEKIWWVDLGMRRLLADPALAPRLEGECHAQLVFSYYTSSDIARGVALRRKREAAGKPVLELKLALLDARIAIGEGRIEAGRNALQRCESLLDSHSLMRAVDWHFLSSRLSMLDNRLGDALPHARLAVRLCMQANYPEQWMGSTVMQEGQVHTARGAPFEAVPFFERAGRASTGAQADYCWCLAHFASALGHADAGQDDAARAEVAAGFAIASRLGWGGFFRATPRVAARLCALALEAGVDSEFVRTVIADRQLEAGQPHFATWPWAIRIRTLGRFEIDVDQARLVLRGKVAKKPLELLQFVIASGGADVATTNATFALWPDLDGDNAKSAFNVALHRLRKLLGSDTAMTLELGRLSLDARSVWVDCLAFESLADQASVPLTASAAASARRAMALYAGHFMAEDEQQAWLAVTRTRLASKFKRLARALAARAVEQGAALEARSLLERAIEVDPLAEDSSRDLMQLLAAEGEVGAALAVFERCRATLAQALGVPPSPATLRLATSLRSEQ